MPLPKPEQGETQQAFISRCMEAEHNASPGTPNDQVAAMCYEAWRNRHKESDFISALNSLARQHKIGAAAEGMTMESVQLTEEVSFQGADFEETDSARRIRNVVMLGPVSRKGYTYKETAMKAAVPLYQGIQCFLNHPTQEEERNGRDVTRLAGSFANARFEGGKIKGDIMLLPDACGQKFWDIAKTMPHAASCSHVADGKLVTENGQRYVEEITKVVSVDLVSKGATTSTVFEGGPRKENEMEWKDIKIDELRTARPDLVSALLQEGEASRDEEVKKLTDSLNAAKKSLDEYTVKEAIAKRKAAVEKMLAESKLPDKAKTDIFREQLSDLPEDGFDAAAKKLIEDRMSVIGGVKNMGGSKQSATLTLAEARKALAG